MDPALDYLFAQTFSIGGVKTCLVTDDDKTAFAADLNTDGGASNYYRILAARTVGGSRTVANPSDLLYSIEKALDVTLTRWQVRMRTNGRVRITYTGTGAGELNCTSCLDVLILLGYDSSIGSPILAFPATGSFIEAANLPTHCILAIAFFPDTGWVRKSQRIAGVTMPDGRQNAWSDGQPGLVRSGEIGLIPETWVFAEPIDGGTPMYPDDTSRWTDPTADEPSQLGPWSVLDQLGNQSNQEWGVSFGELQTLIAGTTTSFDVVSVGLEALKADDSNRPTQSGYVKRWQQAIAVRFIERKAHT